MNLIHKIGLFLNLLRHRGLKIKSQYSRWGEDLFLLDYFKDSPKGYYIDIGAFHPFRGSNTYFLFKKGWSGINIDLNKKSIDLFKIARPKDTNLNLVISDTQKKTKVYEDKGSGKMNSIDSHHASIFIKNSNSRVVDSHKLNDVLEKYNFSNKKIDLIDIDAEGSDYSILSSLDFNKYVFKLILVETHNFDSYFAEKQKKIHTLLESKKYKFIKQFGETSVFENTQWTVSSAG